MPLTRATRLSPWLSPAVEKRSIPLTQAAHMSNGSKVNCNKSGKACRLVLLAHEEGLRVEQGALHTAYPLGQLSRVFAGCSGGGELAAQGLHLRLEVVECAEEDGLGGHGELGGAELVLAVVREDHVLDQDEEPVREGCEGLRALAEHALRDADVADHLALEGVAEAGLPVELGHISIAQGMLRE